MKNKTRKPVFVTRRKQSEPKAWRLVAVALLAALSVVLGKFLSLTVGAFRLSLENLPVILAGVWLSPLAGLTVGVVADVVGSLMVGYVINPIITVGAGLVGLVAGVTYCLFGEMRSDEKLAFAVTWAHLVGSVLVKSVGLRLYYGYPLELLALRIPLYAVIGAVEFLLLRVIMQRVKHLR